VATLCRAPYASVQLKGSLGTGDSQAVSLGVVQVVACQAGTTVFVKHEDQLSGQPVAVLALPGGDALGLQLRDRPVQCLWTGELVWQAQAAGGDDAGEPRLGDRLGGQFQTAAPLRQPRHSGEGPVGAAL